MSNRYTTGQSSSIRKSRLEGKPSLLPKPRRPGSFDRLSTEARRPSTTGHRSSSAEPSRGTLGARMSREASATKLHTNGRSRSQTGETRYSQATTTPLKSSYYSRPTTTPGRTPSEDRNSHSWQTSLERALAFVTIKDQRPLSSAAWQRAESARVSEALAERGAGAALLRPLTIARFVDVVGALLAAVSRDAKLSTDNYVAKLPHLSKRLLYPGAVTKSWLRTVNTLHAYPHALALIAYLLDLVSHVEMPVFDEWLYAGKDELEYLRRDYLYKCWVRFQKPDPQYEDLNEEYLQNLKSLLGHDDEKIAELQQVIKKHEMCLEDEAELAARADEARRVARRDALLAALRDVRAARRDAAATAHAQRAARQQHADEARTLDLDVERARCVTHTHTLVARELAARRDALLAALRDVRAARRDAAATAHAQRAARQQHADEARTLDLDVERARCVTHTHTLVARELAARRDALLAALRDVRAARRDAAATAHAQRAARQQHADEARTLDLDVERARCVTHTHTLVARELAARRDALLAALRDVRAARRDAAATAHAQRAARQQHADAARTLDLDVERARCVTHTHTLVARELAARRDALLAALRDVRAARRDAAATAHAQRAARQQHADAARTLDLDVERARCVTHTHTLVARELAARRDALLAALRDVRAARRDAAATAHAQRAARQQHADAARTLDLDVERASAELERLRSELSSQSLSVAERARLLDDVDYAARVHDSKRALAEQIAKMVMSKETELALWQKKTLDSCVEYKQGLIHLSAQLPALASLTVDENSLMDAECADRLCAAVAALRGEATRLAAARADCARARSALARRRALLLEETRTKIAEMKASVQREQQSLDTELAKETTEAAAWTSEELEVSCRLEQLRALHEQYARADAELDFWEAQDLAWRTRLGELQRYVQRLRDECARRLLGARERRLELVRAGRARWTDKLG